MTELPLLMVEIVGYEIGKSRGYVCCPLFLLSLDRKAEENNGDVLFGTIS
jgi:hypothetical protein